MRLSVTILDELKERAMEAESVEAFISDVGYDSRWMYAFHDGDESEELTDSEEALIDNILKDIYTFAHKE